MDQGGRRAKRAEANPGSSVRPAEPGGAAAIHVNGFRSEPGYTRLSQDDGSIQSKLPQIIYVY